MAAAVVQAGRAVSRGRPGIDPVAAPARIAVAGDWHGSAAWARKACDHARDQGAEVLLHVGDFGYQFIPWFLDAVDGAELPVWFVDGNHDDHDWLARQPVDPDGRRQLSEYVWHLPRGFRWTWDGVQFLACGGAYSVDRGWRVLGSSWWAGETISDDDVARCVAGGRADVLLSHDAPSGFVIPTIDDRGTPAPFPPFALAESGRHRQQLRRVVDAVRPSVVLHGHYHHAYAADVDLGYGQVRVIGLDCDESTMASNVRVVDFDPLGLQIQGRILEINDERNH
jgi:predicted phosphodiesterase